MRRAITDYKMIKNGDKIAVGVSGGKDSLTLLYGLRKLQDFFPEKFSLEAITLTLGIYKTDLSYLKDFCNSIGVNYTVEETLIQKIVFETREEKSPCSLCANMKRGAIHNVAKRLGCNKLALGHHKDDVIETLLMSLFYEGNIRTFSPVTYLGRKELFLIRPLIYTEEEEIRAFAKIQNFKIIKSECLINGCTKRQFIKDIISQMYRDNPLVRKNMFGAIKRSKIETWNNND